MDEALTQLARLHGIALDYRDASGVLHHTSDAVARQLLGAMGVELREDVGALIAAEEERVWRRVLPPVRVFRQGAEAAVPLTLAAGAAQASWRWAVRTEGGAEFAGAFRPDQLTPLGQRRVDGEQFLRVALPLPLADFGMGYHRLSVGSDGVAGEAAAMSLIVAPDRCHLPAEEAGAAPRLWGLAVQLYGLRTRRNWGIGDFGDLAELAEAGAKAGAAFIGLNPLHALFPADPARCSPYSPSSRLFLNVLYIDVEAVPDVRDSAEARARLEDPVFQARLRRQRAAELVDYAEVADLKFSVLRLGFAHFRHEHLFAQSARAQAWKQFRQEGGEPLAVAALFDALHAHWREQDPAAWGWPAWPAAYRSPTAPLVRAFGQSHAEEVEFRIYLQWLAGQQLEAAAARARRHGMALGFYRDLALGADPGGAEVWAEQAVYATAAHIGAPPDDFSPLGQDWGLPPPIPARLQDAAYAPFIATLRANMRHAGALRIDHVMGLTRLFWVAAGASPADGAYIAYPLDDLLGILALESVRQRCLVIGEDLGTVPDDLRETLARHGVLSYRPLYFQRTGDGALQPPASYPQLALATVSTHDLPTLAGFWQGQDIEEKAGLGLFPPGQQERAVLARAQDRAHLLIALHHAALLPPDGGLDPIRVPVLDQRLATAAHSWLARAPSLLLAIQAEDVLGLVEQANLPGAPPDYPNWRRRLPLELETWGSDMPFTTLAAALRNERGERAGRAGTAGVATIPSATYRLQFNRDFTLARATGLIAYLDELGISHCYASSYLKARAGSGHGYDIVDHNALNPEIGDEADFAAFAQALKERGMGQILDIVPNHMGVMGADNAWWLDVLENGAASAHAGFFDIDWQPLDPLLAGKVLLPILGDHYGAVLARGELVLRFAADTGEFSLFYYQHRLPVDPAQYPVIIGHDFASLAAQADGEPWLAELQSLLTAFGHLPGREAPTPAQVAERHRDKEMHKRRLARLCAAWPALVTHIETVLVVFNGRPGEAASFDPLHGLIKRQAWRLAYWRVAADEINYRRFFDINDLAALRMENPAVFDATHGLILSLVAEGKLDGLRIDHADGLYDPAGYFRALQTAAGGGQAPGEGASRPLPLYLVIEKILADHERLPEDWPVHGDTGYRFANLVNGLFVDTGAEARMTRIYEQFIGERRDFDRILRDAKQLIIRSSLHAELNVLANRLWRIAAASRRTCDFTLYGLRDALAEVAAGFPVYRTYVRTDHVSEEDRRHVDWALGLARRRSADADASVFDFIAAVLTGDLGADKDEEYRQDIWRFAMKFQQFTAPVMAKGMEDTAFYRYHRLVSLNDVGGDPRRLGTSVAAFHAANRARAERWPHAMLGGSTHDSKRSEDVRARIDVLSEIPAAWKLAVRRWSRFNRSKKTVVGERLAPSANDEYLLYQTLFGTWPLGPGAEGELADFTARLQSYVLKAAREAKENTSWTKPEAEYEKALTSFVESVLPPGDKNLFLADFVPAVRHFARFGLINSLAQTLFRLTAPGVPDLYQGAEMWQWNLVDPDNRRPVDYGARHAALTELRAMDEAPPERRRQVLRTLAADMEDGRIKLYLVWRVLQLRRRRPEVFRSGSYVPLAAAGAEAEHAVAFARQHGPHVAIAVAPRLLARRERCRRRRGLAEADWQDTRIDLPSEWRDVAWNDVLADEPIACGADGGLPLATVLRHFPVALLVGAVGPHG